MSDADREIVYRLRPVVDEGAEAEFDKLSTLAEQVDQIMRNRFTSGIKEGIAAGFATSAKDIAESGRKAFESPATSKSAYAAGQRDAKAYANGFDQATKAQVARAGSKKIVGFAAAASGHGDVNDPRQVAAAQADIEHLRNMMSLQEQVNALKDADRKKDAAERDEKKRFAAANKQLASLVTSGAQAVEEDEQVFRARRKRLRDAKREEAENDRVAAERTAQENEEFNRKMTELQIKDLQQTAKKVAAERAASAKEMAADEKKAAAERARAAKEAMQDEKKRVAAQRAAERAAESADFKQVMAQQHLRQATMQAITAVSGLTRGFVELGLVGEEDLNKVKDALLQVYAAADIVRGGIEIWDILTRGVRIYTEALHAASAVKAQAIAANANAMLAGAAGVGQHAGGGLLFGAGETTGSTLMARFFPKKSAIMSAGASAAGSAGASAAGMLGISGAMGGKAAVTAGLINNSSLAFSGMTGTMGAAATGTAASQVASGAAGLGTAGAAGAAAAPIALWAAAITSAIAGLVSFGDMLRQASKHGLGGGADSGGWTDTIAKAEAGLLEWTASLAKNAGVSEGIFKGMFTALGGPLTLLTPGLAGAAYQANESAKALEKLTEVSKKEMVLRAERQKREVEDYRKRSMESDEEHDAITKATYLAARKAGLQGIEIDAANYETNRQQLLQKLAAQRAEADYFSGATSGGVVNEQGRADALAKVKALQEQLYQLDLQRVDVIEQMGKTELDAKRQVLSVQTQQLANIQQQLKTVQGSLKSDYAKFADLKPEEQGLLKSARRKLEAGEELNKQEAGLAGQFDAFREATINNRELQGRREAGDLFGERERRAADLKRRAQRAEERRWNTEDQILKIEVQIEKDKKTAIERAEAANSEQFGIGDDERRRIVKDAVEQMLDSPTFKKGVEAIVTAKQRLLQQTRAGKGI